MYSISNVRCLSTRYSNDSAFYSYTKKYKNSDLVKSNDMKRFNTTVKKKTKTNKDFFLDP